MQLHVPIFKRNMSNPQNNVTNRTFIVFDVECEIYFTHETGSCNMKRSKSYLTRERNSIFNVKTLNILYIHVSSGTKGLPYEELNKTFINV